MQDLYKYYKENAEKIYRKQSQIYCPYFEKHIKLNSNGLHHLQFSNQKERSKAEKILKFKLLPSALKVIKITNTLQEYRKTESKINRKRYAKNKSRIVITVEYFGFISIEPNKKNRIKVIIKKIGNGDLFFWSVMPNGKYRRTN